MRDGLAHGPDRILKPSCLGIGGSQSVQEGRFGKAGGPARLLGQSDGFHRVAELGVFACREDSGQADGRRRLTRG